MKKVSTLSGIIIIVIAVIILFGGVFAYQYFAIQKNQQASNIQQTAGWKTYKNTKYGFQMTFPDSWKGYIVVERGWQGNRVDNFSEKFTGPELIFKNPKTTPTQAYQDIPIMVISHVVWDLIQSEQVAVSAAPIGPEKVGENDRYVFATPPRWYGFTDAIGFQEAVNIVKTFKAF